MPFKPISKWSKTLILFSDERSGSCRRVLAVIKHLELDIKIENVDILAGETKSPDFLELNPQGKLPVLVDGDVILTEAAAIMLYICDQFKDTSLNPTGAERFQMLRWMFWAAEHFRTSAPIYFEEKLIAIAMGGQPDEARLAEADRRIDEFAPMLDKHLSENNFVLGETPSLADFDLAAPLSQMTRTGVPYEKYPNIMRWDKSLEEAIPAWKETGERLRAGINAAFPSN